MHDIVTPSPPADANRRPRILERTPTANQQPEPVSMQEVDRAVRAGIARLTGGIAPTAVAGAFLDWAVHVAASPGKQLSLIGQAMTAAVENASFAGRAAIARPGARRVRAARGCARPLRADEMIHAGNVSSRDANHRA
jgi:hypothetical protein